MNDFTDFDVDAWLTEARPPQRAVTVYGRGDLVSRLQELTEQRKATAGEARMGGHPLDPDISRLRAEVEESRKVFHVRGLLNAERDDLVEKHTTKKIGEGEDEEDFNAVEYEAEAFALAVLSPKLNIDQVKQMHAAIGEGQWRAIGTAVEVASREPVDVPLSRLGSESTQTS
jgi:hypothetical protein